jgi:hypothetical protein
MTAIDTERLDRLTDGAVRVSQVTALMTHSNLGLRSPLPAPRGESR